MSKQPTLIAPTLEGPSTSGAGDLSEALPPDLLEQVRGRLQLLALLLFVAFAFDPLIYGAARLYFRVQGEALPADFQGRGAFQLAYIAAAVASGFIWWIAKQPRFRPATLLSLGLAYEVVVCFLISLTNTLEYYRSHGILPSMDWVPSVVILFPLVLPGPPRRMLIAAAIAAAMSPLAQAILHLTGQIQATADSYFSAAFHGAFAVGFAYMGARVVYGLGREVARARELGSYHLGELLGRGGMGEVYRATHRMLARPAAIKLIRPDLLGVEPARAQEAIRRFRREAEVAASLRSPHTVELYDFGVTPDRTFYFVMELLEGVDLESLVARKGPLPAARVVFLVRQACESLAEAHARGLVHRDIKPANLHVGRLGLRHDFLKVLDFGLVKSVATPEEASVATGTGAVAGTPAYMAPEVALGEPFDGRADVYAIGCVLHFLLTGRTVFEAPSPMAVITRHVRDTPAPPSSRTELPVAPAVDALVLRCLAKAPADRPTVDELTEALAALPVGPWGEEDARRWWQAHQLAQ